MSTVYTDREDAAERLAEALGAYRDIDDGIVIALPRGGVVLGRIVADRLGLPLDIVVPRKIGSPSNPEYAIGALTEVGDIVWNETERPLHDSSRIEAVVEREKAEAKRRMDIYRKGLSERIMSDRTVIIVDDGIATGYTMMAAIKTVKAAKAKKVVVAVPVAPSDSVRQIEGMVDEMVTLEIPKVFWAVGAHYAHFGEVTDDEVVALLQPEKRQEKGRREE